MKDELRELEMDESTRKTATDWLMHVISGKKVNGNGNGSGHSEVLGLGGAVAVAEMPETEAPRAPEAATEFTAEDLCGAPTVPVVKVVAPKDEITADDVCWVPEEMRLKPQPPAVEETPASKVRVMPSPESREELDFRRPAPAREPELSFLTGPSETVITAADISRNPAPYVVEPTWNGVVIEPEPTVITAADITRGPHVDYGPEPSSSDLPTSFRVIRSLATQAPEATAPATEPPVIKAPVIEAAAPVVETALPVVEPTEHAIEAAVPIAEAVAPALETPAPAFETSASISECVAPVVETAEEVSRGAVAEAVAPVEPEAHQAEAMPAHSEAPTEEVSPTLEAAATEGEASAEVKSDENVFARQGFWGEAAKTGLSEDEVSPKAILRGMKRAYSASDEEFDKHPEGWFTAWKTMLRLGSVLPWVARALPALESGALSGEPGAAAPSGTTGATGVAQETRQDVAGLRLVQYEIRTTVQDHSMQLKRVEEQLTRVRETIDSRSSENAAVAEDLRAMAKLVRLAGMGLGALLLVLIILVVVMLAHH